MADPGTRASANTGNRVHCDELDGGVHFLGHAFDQTRNRGLTPSVVENALKTGARTPGNTAATTVITDAVNKVKILVNPSGRIITVE